MTNTNGFNCMAPAGIVWILSSSAAFSAINPRKPIGYETLGIYTTIDFAQLWLTKVSVKQVPFENKQGWWDGVHSLRKQGRYLIPQVWFWDSYTEKDRGGGPISKYIERFDALLSDEDGTKTYPEDLMGICLAEENVPGAGDNFNILNQIARHIQKRYHIPVYQWYSDPIPPNPKQVADGWIFDSYFWPNPKFRRHLMKFVALGKPVVCVVWAAEPGWKGYHPDRYKTADDLIQDTDQQFQTCREFNVPVALFAVAGEHGSVSTWHAGQDVELLKLRQYIARKHSEMLAVQSGELPSSSANFSDGRPILLEPEEKNTATYVDSFDSVRFIEDADINGFLDLVLTAEGSLAVKSQDEGKTCAMITYHFLAEPEVDDVEVRVRGIAPRWAKAKNCLAVSLNGKEWDISVVQQDADESGEFVLHAVGPAEKIQRTRQFWIRLTMSHEAKGTNDLVNQIDRLEVRTHSASKLNQ